MVNSRFTESVISFMRDAISKAQGNEVFFGGVINQEGVVISVEVAARGHKSAVPVQSEIAQRAHVLIHNHPSGGLQPSEADLAVASHAAERSQGFYIVNNDISDVYVVVEPVKPKKIVKLDLDNVAHYISAGGPLDASSDFFEERPSQIDLLRNICSVLNDNGIGVFEAGTGVGKSYGYLIPAILWAFQNKQRIVISTGTINLQQQLAEKDLPAAKKITGKDIKSILLKGRQNYVCLRRLNDVAKEPDLFFEGDELNIILEWIKETGTGSRSDLSFVPSEYLWSRICSESDACMGMKCPYHQDCFVMKVRKEAADALILVVNHHLLFADIEMRMGGFGYEDMAVLPPYKHIVFDEAHGMENAATSFFSESFTKFKIARQLNILYRKRKNGSLTGHVFALTALSQEADMSGEIISATDYVLNQCKKLDMAALDVLENQYTLRLKDSTEKLFVSVLVEMEKLGKALVDCTGLFRELIESIDEELRDSAPVWETKSVLRRLESMAQLCKNFVSWSEKEETVFFIEKARSSSQGVGESPVFCRFIQAPLHVSYKMNEGIFETMDSVVCTSATIKSGNSFNYWLQRSGICFADQERVCVKDFESPFPYDRNMLMAIPQDIPFPDSRDYFAYIEKAVSQLILAVGGKTLVLFTSYEALRSTWEGVRALLVGSGITVLKQGDDDRFRLLEHFKTDISSVLFATDSFWEGVDVPGESLSQVIIAKLPFSVPSDPIFAARCEAIEKKGGNPFVELSIPDAVIKFRQGVGRLIRRSTDRGVVIILDKRIITKPYGKTFLSSIPSCKHMVAPLEDIKKSVEYFIG